MGRRPKPKSLSLSKKKEYKPYIPDAKTRIWSGGKLPYYGPVHLIDSIISVAKDGKVSPQMHYDSRCSKIVPDLHISSVVPVQCVILDVLLPLLTAHRWAQNYRLGTYSTSSHVENGDAFKNAFGFLSNTIAATLSRFFESRGCDGDVNEQIRSFIDCALVHCRAEEQKSHPMSVHYAGCDEPLEDTSAFSPPSLDQLSSEDIINFILVGGYLYRILPSALRVVLVASSTLTAPVFPPRLFQQQDEALGPTTVALPGAHLLHVISLDDYAADTAAILNEPKDNKSLTQSTRCAIAMRTPPHSVCSVGSVACVHISASEAEGGKVETVQISTSEVFLVTAPYQDKLLAVSVMLAPAQTPLSGSGVDRGELCTALDNLKLINLTDQLRVNKAGSLNLPPRTLPMAVSFIPEAASCDITRKNRMLNPCGAKTKKGPYKDIPYSLTDTEMQLFSMLGSQGEDNVVCDVMAKVCDFMCLAGAPSAEDDSISEEEEERISSTRICKSSRLRNLIRNLRISTRGELPASITSTDSGSHIVTLGGKEGVSSCTVTRKACFTTHRGQVIITALNISYRVAVVAIDGAVPASNYPAAATVDIHTLRAVSTDPVIAQPMCSFGVTGLMENASTITYYDWLSAYFSKRNDSKKQLKFWEDACEEKGKTSISAFESGLGADVTCDVHAFSNLFYATAANALSPPTISRIVSVPPPSIQLIVARPYFLPTSVRADLSGNSSLLARTRPEISELTSRTPLTAEKTLDKRNDITNYYETSEALSDLLSMNARLALNTSISRVSAGLSTNAIMPSGDKFHEDVMELHLLSAPSSERLLDEFKSLVLPTTRKGLNNDPIDTLAVSVLGSEVRLTGCRVRAFPLVSDGTTTTRSVDNVGEKKLKSTTKRSRDGDSSDGEDEADASVADKIKSTLSDEGRISSLYGGGCASNTSSFDGFSPAVARVGMKRRLSDIAVTCVVVPRDSQECVDSNGETPLCREEFCKLQFRVQLVGKSSKEFYAIGNNISIPCLPASTQFWRPSGEAAPLAVSSETLNTIQYSLPAINLAVLLPRLHTGHTFLNIEQCGVLRNEALIARSNATSADSLVPLRLPMTAAGVAAAQHRAAEVRAAGRQNPMLTPTEREIVMSLRMANKVEAAYYYSPWCFFARLIQAICAMDCGKHLPEALFVTNEREISIVQFS